MNPDDKISKYFTWREALWLPTWKRMATEDDGLNDEIKANLTALFTKLDSVREKLGPIIVHVAYRPEAYNKLIGGATNSAHKYGKAVDFHADDLDIEEAKDIILKDNLLETLDLRMEASTPTWIHLGNDYTQGHNRVFLP